MSGARMDGHMPRPGQILGVLDEAARRTLTEAKDLVVPIVKQEAPGHLGDDLKGTVRRTPTGYRATVQAPPKKRHHSGATVAQVLRWVNRGTGIYRKGPGAKKLITGKRGVLRPMTLPSGKRVRTIRGQHPNPFIARSETRAIVPVQAVLERGAKRAADALKRL